MLKHIEKEHDGKVEDVEFEWDVIGSFPKPLLRQLNEAICIEHKNEDENLNIKNEYFKNYASRLTSLFKFQCEFCSKKLEEEEDLKNHIKEVHVRIQCENCPYLSFGKKDMKQHEKYSHNKIQ